MGVTHVDVFSCLATQSDLKSFSTICRILRTSAEINEQRMPGKKSGRFWKSDRDRFRSVIKTKGLKQSLKQKTRLKEEKTKAKLYEQSLKAATQREKEELRARQEENKKKREANQKKSEVVQEVKNLSKLKRMRKKQLRTLAKRDTVKT